MTADPFSKVVPDLYVASVLLPWDEAQRGDDAILADFGLKPHLTERDVAFEARTVIRGAPGSGKSALLREVARLVPTDELAVPIFLQFARPAEGAPRELLKRWVQTGNASFQIDLLETQRVHLLFDGLDELAPAEQQAYAEAIAAIGAEYPQHRMTIASRPVPALDVFASPWKIFQLSPGNLWREAFLAAHGVGWPELAARYPGIHDASELLQLPFFLKSLLFLDRSGAAEISDLWSLVRALTERALARDVEPVGLSPQDAHAWLQAVALTMRLLGRSRARLAELERIPLPQGVVGSTEAVCEALVQRAMLRQQGDEYVFVHRIIGESLAAEALAAVEIDDLVMDAIVPVLPSGESAVRDDWLVPLMFLAGREQAVRTAVAKRDELGAARLVPASADPDERRWAAQTIWRQFVEWRIWLFRHEGSELLEDGRILIRLLEAGDLDDVVAEIESALTATASQTRVNAEQVLAALGSQVLRAALGDLLADEDPVVRRYAGIAADTLDAVEVLPGLQERLMETVDDLEEQDLAFATLRLTPSDQLEEFAHALVERKPRSHAVWRAQLEIAERVGPSGTLSFMRAWALRDRAPILVDEQRDVVGLAEAAGDKAAIRDAAYLLAAWGISGDREFEFVARHPREAWSGMADALRDEVAYEYDLARFLRAFPLGVLEEAEAPELLVRWRREAEEPQEEPEPRPKAMPKPAPARPPLRELLLEDPEDADPKLLQWARTFRTEVEELSLDERRILSERLETWWPADGARSAVTFTDESSWNMSYGLAAWLAFASALYEPIDPERWAEVASLGITYGEESEWLRRQWTPAATAAVIRHATDAAPRIWASVLRSVPEVSVELARTVAERVELKDAADPYTTEIAHRLAEAEQTDALRDVVRRFPEAAPAVLPYLGASGDQDAIRKLLRSLIVRMEGGDSGESDPSSATWLDHRGTDWLEAAQDPDLLPDLFAALRAVLVRGRDPFGPSAALERAIARVDGVEALERYDDLIQDEGIEGAQFLRYSRDAIALRLLRAQGAAAARDVLVRAQLPVFEK